MLDGTGSFNLLIGANDVGKTSALEAIFLLTGLTNIHLPIVIQDSRELDTASFDAMETLFRNLNTAAPIRLSCSQPNGSEKFRLEISAGTSDSNVIERSVTSPMSRQVNGDDSRRAISSGNIPSSTSSLTVSKTLHYNAEVADSNGSDAAAFRGIISYTPNDGIQFSRLPRDSKLAAIPAILVNARAAGGYQEIEEVVIRKLDDDLLAVLRQVNPEILSINVVNQTVFADIGLERLVPLNTLGSGLIRLANIYSTALSLKTQILLIDEIENGLHHEAVVIFLEALLNVVGNKGIQVFATTHSLEVLKGLQTLLRRESFSSIREDVKCFKMAKDKDGKVIGYRYDHDQFDHCIRHGIEIR